MEIKKLKEIKAPLLNRKRINFEINFSKKSTPTKKDLRIEIAKNLKNKPQLVVIRHIYQKFGQNTAKVIANIYDDEETLKSLEGEKAIFKEEKPKETENKKEEEKPKETEKPKDEKVEETDQKEKKE